MVAKWWCGCIRCALVFWGVCGPVALYCHVVRGRGGLCLPHVFRGTCRAVTRACPNTATPVFPHFGPANQHLRPPPPPSILRETLQLAESLMKLLMDKSQQKYDEWASKVGAVSTERLQHNLLRRDLNTRQLFVNFDPELVRVLREVSYIEKIDALDGEGV